MGGSDIAPGHQGSLNGGDLPNTHNDRITESWKVDMACLEAQSGAGQGSQEKLHRGELGLHLADGVGA